MDRVYEKRLISRILLFSSMLAMFCILTFVCVTPTQLYASETTTEDAVTSQDAVTDTSEDTGVSGTIGGLSFEFLPTSDGDTNSWSATLQILLVLTVISLAPSILIMMTSFTRIIIVLHFVRITSYNVCYTKLLRTF